MDSLDPNYCCYLLNLLKRQVANAIMRVYTVSLANLNGNITDSPVVGPGDPEEPSICKLMILSCQLGALFFPMTLTLTDTMALRRTPRRIEL